MGAAARARSRASAPSRPPRSHGLVAYVGLRGFALRAGDAPFNGIAKTTDGGATWTVVHAEAGPARPRSLDGSWIEERALDGRPFGLVRRALRPGRGARRSRRLLRHRPLPHLSARRTAARRWAQVQLRARAAPTSGRAAASTSPPPTASTGTRSTRRRVFITYTDIGLFRSEDGGETLDRLHRSGVPTRWRNTTYWVAFDPEVQGLHVGRLQRDARPARGRRCGGAPTPTRFQGGVGVSNDGGRTLDAVERGHAGVSAITHVLLDPTSPAGPRARSTRRPTAAASSSRRTTAARGRSRTRDSPARQPFAWRITPRGRRTLYLVVARRSERGAHRRRRRRRALSLDRTAPSTGRA